METRADGVNRDGVAALIGAVEVERADDQQLLAAEPLVLLRSDDRAEDARDNHVLVNRES
ncbi:MAG: hypothetical protein ACJ741_02975 [Pyrinomonadaceae bacterium]